MYKDKNKKEKKKEMNEYKKEFNLFIYLCIMLLKATKRNHPQSLFFLNQRRILKKKKKNSDYAIIININMTILINVNIEK